MDKPKKIVKTKTAICDLLEWIDRVEERGITQLSTEKIRERIKERVSMEKQVIFSFSDKLLTSGSPRQEVFENHFIQDKSKSSKELEE